MNYNKYFKSFLQILNVNYQNLTSSKLANKNGKSFPLDIDADQLKSFEWAYYLAKENELILLKSDQDTMQSIDTFEKYLFQKTNAQYKLGELYKKDIQNHDFERFELSKDIYYLIRDISNEIIKNVIPFSSSYCMYIEDGSSDNFILGFIDKKNYKKFLKIADKLGLQTFYILGNINHGGLYKNNYQCAVIDEKKVPKNFYKSDRNDNLIAKIKDEQAKHNLAELNYVMSKEDEEKLLNQTKKLYEEIANYGLKNYLKNNPNENFESLLLDVFSILLYKNWATYQEIVDLEINTGYFFHLLADELEIPTKQELILQIKNILNENK